MTKMPFPVLRPSQLPELTFHRPESLHELLGLLESGAHPIAGGTDILLWASHDGRPAELAWTCLVDDLQHFETGNDPFRVGAAIKLSTLLCSAEFRAGAPAVFDGVKVIGSVQMRNQATLLGNVCTASPAGDTLPGLLVHGAVLETINVSGGKRRLALDEFLLAPGVNKLQAGELATSISIRPLVPGEASAFRRFTERRSLDLAFASVAARISFEEDGQTVRKARLALGAVGPCAFMAADAAAALDGRPLNAASLSRCAEAAAEYCSPISDHRASSDYRRQLVKVLVHDVVTEIQGQADASRRMESA
jgi:CO/xanthine dehydrogenase FAD-binding subunit